MDAATKALMIEQFGKITSSFLRMVLVRPSKTPLGDTVDASYRRTDDSRVENQVASHPSNFGLQRVAETEMPTTQQTIEELKRRLAKELYRLELDLGGGLRINNLPCDCAGYKHSFGVEATAEELMSYEHNPLYGKILAWYATHLPEFEPAEIMRHDAEYYRAMIPDLRGFRKELLGTEPAKLVSPAKPAPASAGRTLTLEDAKKLAADQAAREVEKQWYSLKEK